MAPPPGDRRRAPRGHHQRLPQRQRRGVECVVRTDERLRKRKGFLMDDLFRDETRSLSEIEAALGHRPHQPVVRQSTQGEATDRLRSSPATAAVEPPSKPRDVTPQTNLAEL